MPANLPETNPYTSAADLAMGRGLYNGRCGHCHGQNGEGGRGAALNTGRFRHGGSDRELFLTIRHGIPDTEMPGACNLTDMEIWRMVGYVQQLGRQGASDPSTGDADGRRGRLRAAPPARSATRSAGREASSDPDLTDIGARRAVRHLRQSIADPNADIALDYRSVTVTDAKGASISGIHLNEDEYSVHLRDLAGNLRSFMKSELTDVTLPRQSLMPAYPTLTPADLENLVAYLGSLRPARTPRGGPAGGHAPSGRSTGWRASAATRRPCWASRRSSTRPLGKAVEFDGVDDALFIDNHPLAGATTFTWEAIFRPDGGETRAAVVSSGRAGSRHRRRQRQRMLFEIRVTGDVVVPGQPHPVRSREQDAHEPDVAAPAGCVVPRRLGVRRQGIQELRRRRAGGGGRSRSSSLTVPGHTSVGVRINKVFYFKGAVHLARFTRRALSPAEFLKPPAK